MSDLESAGGTPRATGHRLADTAGHTGSTPDRAVRPASPPTDGGPWRGPSLEEWVERIARGSTPVREYVDGKFQPWIDAERKSA
jgi:hypothetical protein